MSNIQRLLRPSEAITASLRVQDVDLAVRVLLVVTNLDNAYEEGSILVLKQTNPGQGQALISTIIRIDDALSINMAQSPAHSVSSSADDKASPRPSPVSKSFFQLNVADEQHEFIFFVTSAHDLSLFVSECKRLKSSKRNSPEATFRWLSYYIKRQLASLPASASTPTDLRELLKPLNSRLSPASAGHNGNEESDVEVIKDLWLRDVLEKKIAEYAETSVIKIRICTFNVNGKSPSQDLSSWVRPQGRPQNAAGEMMLLPLVKPISPLSLPDEDPLGNPQFTSSEKTRSADSDLSLLESRNSDSEPDLLVFGFQELDLSAEALLYSSTTVKEDAWTAAIFAGLGEARDNYIKAASKQLVGMLIVLLAKKSVAHRISDVQSSSVGNGIMGMMGNKGATALRLKFDSTTLTFVNSHLAAFDTGLERRNSDFHDLSERVVFANLNDRDDEYGTDEFGYESANTEEPSVDTIYHSDALFWLGDLNYRIDLPDSDTRSLLSEEGRLQDLSLYSLFQHDQLHKAMTGGHAFDGFKEERITHLPTYRFASGIVSDDMGYDIKRRPAWTDRILYMALPSKVVQTSYKAHPLITMSDHKPLSAAFLVETKSIDVRKLEQFLQKTQNLLGDFESSEEPPKIKIESPTMDLGEVRFQQASLRKFQLENIGKVTCAYRFISADDRYKRDIYPPWLTVTPMAGLILPGETVNITLQILVNRQCAMDLNMGREKLEELVILHIERGQDHFISVSGTYARTCLANDLSSLSRLSDPIRSSDPKNTLPEEQANNAPKEIMRLINWIMSSVAYTPGLFMEPADKELVAKLIECLDTGADFPLDANDKEETKAKLALAMGEALFVLLDSLVTPVIPSTDLLHAQCIQASNRDEAFELLSLLPQASVNVWISVTALLHFVGQQQESESASQLLAIPVWNKAALFAPVLMKDDAKNVAPVSPVAKRRFLSYFIEE